MTHNNLHYTGGCEVVGESYYKDAIAGLGTITRDYYWPTELLYQKFVEGDRVYKYSFDELDAELIPEPNNQYDPNAIRVDVNGVTVGHVAKDNTARIRNMLESGPIVKANITGGPHKEISETEDGMLASEKEDYDFRVRLSFYEQDLAQHDAEPSRRGQVSQKNYTATLLLCLFLGLLGIHRFYVGKTGTGILWLLTGGLLGFGAIFDLIMILSNMFEDWDGAPVLSERAKARRAEYGVDPKQGRAAEVCTWVFLTLAILGVVFEFVSGFLPMPTPYLFAVGMLVALVCGFMAYVLSGKAFE